MSEQNPTTISVSSKDVRSSLKEKNLTLADINLKAVKILFVLEYEGRKSKRPVRIELTSNSRATLPKNKDGKIIEEYLKAQKVLISNAPDAKPLRP